TGGDSLRGSYGLPRTSLHAALPDPTERRPGAGITGATLKKPQRPGKDAARSRSRIWQWITGTIGGCAVALGFVGTLWLTGRTPPAPAISILTNAVVSDAASLMAAVQTARLRGTPDVKGSIEEITRLDKGRVSIKGWVTDTTGSGSALTVIAFAGGNHVLTTGTKGAHAALPTLL